MDSKRHLLFALNELPGLDGWLKRRVFDNCRDEGDLPAAIEEYRRLRSPRSRAVLPNADTLLRTAETNRKRLDYYRIQTLVLGESAYPRQLAMIADPPMLLFVRGQISSVADTGDERSPAIAIVGTRRPTDSAMRQGFRIGMEFAAEGYPVVSGLAFGIDRAAHDGALASGGPTWAVLAGGLDRPGPKAHRRLASRILETGGALVGEVVPGSFPAKYAFPRRNRILSGLARGCIVVQAPGKSGALITAEFALDQGRDLYVASTGLHGVTSRGSRNLEEQGAPVVADASDVLMDWGLRAANRPAKEWNMPESGIELAEMMKMELDGRMVRYMGGWFEYRST